MNMPPIISPAEVSDWRAAFWFFVSFRRYINLAPGHVLALNLKKPDLLAKFNKNEFPQSGWDEDERIQATEHGLALWRSLRISVLAVLAFVVAGVIASALYGKISPALPIAWPKVLSLTGGFLAAWGTILQLGGYAESWGGNNLHEIIRPIIFKALFLPGLFLATVGQLL
jgi:hypothetical protein